MKQLPTVTELQLCVRNNSKCYTTYINSFEPHDINMK